MATCGQCGIEHPDGFRFCPGCGASLAAAERPRESRKIVTALFCDVTGSRRWEKSLIQRCCAG